MFTTAGKVGRITGLDPGKDIKTFIDHFHDN